MKTRFRNYTDLASAWVDAVENGENGNFSVYGDRMFSRGNAIYSYGNHFCIANVVETDKGRVILFNHDNYSKTTSKHKHAVGYAIRWLGKRFDVPYVMPRWGGMTAEHHYANLIWFKQQQEFYLDRATRARSRKQEYLNEAARYEHEANEYVQYFPEAVAYRLTRKVA